MKKKKLKRYILYSIILIILFVSLSFVILPNTDIGKLKISVAADESATLQLYYIEEGKSDGFDEEHSILESISKLDKYKNLSLVFPFNIKELRLDFGNAEGNIFRVKFIEIIKGNKKCELSISKLSSLVKSGKIEMNQISVKEKKGQIELFTTGSDPYILLPLDDFKPINYVPYFLGAFIVSILLLIYIYKYVHLKEVCLLAKSIYIERRLLLSLGINDFKVKYSGSYFGIIWAFVQPICTILIFWFVFEFGLRSSPVSDIPFALWLSAGLIPWFFFSEAWNSATNAFVEYSYLVKKIVFKIDILPLVKTLSAFFVHLFFVGFLIIMYAMNGIYPQIRMLGLLYYMTCMVVLAIGLSFITASIVVFFKDLTQIMNIILQILMWLTPIMWNINMLPTGMIKFFKLNPMFYVVEGYRNCMIGSMPLFPSMNQTIYFWLVAIFILITGISLFQKLRVHFADVL